MLKWDGDVVMDGVLGRSGGAVLRRFDRRQNNNASFCWDIADAMAPSRWLKIKRAVKSNNNPTATRDGDANHDPAQKCNCIC